MVFGQFTAVPDDPANEERPVERLLQEVADSLGVPAFAGAPVGHVSEQWTIPLGAVAELDADARTLKIIR